MQPRRGLKRQPGVTLIDLGEIGAHGDQPDPGPSPWARRVGVPDGRKAAAVAALALLAGGLAGNAPAARPDPPIRVMRDVNVQASLWVVDDVLIHAGGDSTVMTATDLPTGNRLWSSMVGPTIYHLAGVDGIVVVQTAPNINNTSSEQEAWSRAVAQGHLTALDARTGIERWRHPGSMLSPYESEGAVVMLVPSDALPDHEPGRWLLAGVDHDSGRDLWIEPLSDRTQWSFGYAGARPDRLDPTRLTLVDPDGTVSAVDTASGRRTPQGKLPAESSIEWSWMNLIGVRRPDPYAPIDPSTPAEPAQPVDPALDPRPARFEVYDVGDLTAPLWGRPIESGYAPNPCAENMLCIPVPNRMDRVDVRTGAPAPPADDYADFFEPGRLGLWQIYSFLADSDALAFVSPSASKTREGWLGVVRFQRPEPQVVPLARVPIGIEACWPTTARWIICPGVAGTIAMRQSDLDAMIAAIPGQVP